MFKSNCFNDDGNNDDIKEQKQCKSMTRIVMWKWKDCSRFCKCSGAWYVKMEYGNKRRFHFESKGDIKEYISKEKTEKMRDFWVTLTNNLISLCFNIFM